LAGIRVLDLTSNIAGPCATMVLADLGATVTKVERPDGGDDGRQMRPHQGPWGAYFVAINRGKRSLALDLRKPEARAVVLRLAGQSDVFVENFRGGKAAELGLDEAALRGAKADIIYASLSAYGPRGPEYEKAGYDALLQGRTGIVSVTGAARGGPARAGVSVLDMGSGIWVALGIVAALLERKNSGRGQRVDGSLFQTGVMWMAYHLLFRQFTGVDPSPEGTRHPAFAPYGDFPTADGRVLIGISNDRLFARLCTALESADWAAEWTKDPRYATNLGRVKHRDELDGRIAVIVQNRTTAEWLARFDSFGVPASPVQTAGELLNDPQLEAIHQLADLELPGTGGKQCRVPQLPLEFSVTPAAVSGPPPLLGEHGMAVLKEAGFTDEEIAALVGQGVVTLGPRE
jgi:crotonobetainyl-CoA:carnitine CoA-transferase CaiB-like acyl-CoA transferase